MKSKLSAFFGTIFFHRQGLSAFSGLIPEGYRESELPRLKEFDDLCKMEREYRTEAKINGYTLLALIFVTVANFSTDITSISVLSMAPLVITVLLLIGYVVTSIKLHRKLNYINKTLKNALDPLNDTQLKWCKDVRMQVGKDLPLPRVKYGLKSFFESAYRY